MGRAAGEQDGTSRDGTLVVSAHTAARGRLVRLLAPLGAVDVAPDGDTALALLEARRASPHRLVVLDVRGHAPDSRETVLCALEGAAEHSALLVVAEPSFRAARQAMRCGARDVLWSPFDESELVRRCRKLLTNGPAAAAAPGRRAGAPLRASRVAEPVAESEAMRRTLSLARRVAPTRSRVLLSGETGTGKEVLAELIHMGSGRVGPLVRVNCAALPETLLESEMFGHERGAFTGADRQRIGRFEQARGGTLFLDEVGELPPSTQVKLLRVLQQNEFQRLGGSETIASDVRVLAATNRDLPRAVGEGHFRKDLYYRLAVVGIHLAPLRERRADVPELAARFVRELCADFGLGPKVLTPGALEALCAEIWPGNVRQLRNTLERAVITTRRRRIAASDLVADASCEPEPPAIRSAPSAESGPFSLAAAEREVVIRALDRAGYVQKEAARLMGVSRRKLNYMIQRMGVTHPSWRRNRGPRAGVEEAGAGAVLQSGPSDLY